MNNEPVAWMDKRTNKCVVFINTPPSDDWIPLYTHPVKEWNRAKDRFPNYETICLQCGTTIYKPFKELTDEEIQQVLNDFDWFVKFVNPFDFARAILRKAQEK